MYDGLGAVPQQSGHASSLPAPPPLPPPPPGPWTLQGQQPQAAAPPPWHVEQALPGPPPWRTDAQQGPVEPAPWTTQDRSRSRERWQLRSRSRSKSRERTRSWDTDRRRRSRSPRGTRSRSRDRHRGRHRRMGSSSTSRSRSRSRSRGRAHRADAGSSRHESDSRERHRERERDHSDRRRESRRSRSRSRERGSRGSSHTRVRESGSRPHRTRSRSRSRSKESHQWTREWDRGKRRECNSEDEDAYFADRSQRRGETSEGTPSASVFIKGIPETCTESDLSQALEAAGAHPISVRIVRDRNRGLPRGFGFADFISVEDCQAFMKSEGRRALTLDGQRLSLEYTAKALSSSNAATGGAGPSAALADWVCDMCQAVNFSRRLECHQCCSPRPAAPKRVVNDSDMPSSVLKVSGVEDACTEEALTHLFAALVPVTDVRIARDRYTGAPRGFAFVEFTSVADAARALSGLQGAVPAGQSRGVSLCYARDRATQRRGGGNTAGERHAMATHTAAIPDDPAQAILALTGWAPAEYKDEGEEDAKQDAAAASVVTGGVAESTDPVHSATGADPSAAGQDPAATSDYVYDAVTGYYHIPSSGCHYDPNTGLYYVPGVNQWCTVDEAGQYVPVVEEQHASHQSTELANAAQPAVATSAEAAAAPVFTHPLAVMAGLVTPGLLPASRSTTAADAKTQPARRQGPVIGSAPVSNPDGLMQAARQIEAKPEKLTKAKPVATSKAFSAPAHAGLGTPTMTAAAVAPPVMSSGPAVATPSVPATQAVIASGPVKGVIHKGKWSQRQQAAKQ